MQLVAARETFYRCAKTPPVLSFINALAPQSSVTGVTGLVTIVTRPKRHWVQSRIQVVFTERYSIELLLARIW